MAANTRSPLALSLLLLLALASPVALATYVPVEFPLPDLPVSFENQCSVRG
jgi:hypothetical protein